MGVAKAVQGKLYTGFYNWGTLIGRRPFCVAFVAFFLALAGCVRLFLAPKNPLPSVVEQDQLWVPQTAQAVTDKGKYDSIFNNTFRRNTVYFTTKPKGGNVLTPAILEEIRRFDLMVTEQLNATAFGAGARRVALEDEHGHPAVEYNDVCAKSSVVLGRNLSDPNDEGGIPCILFGHPLEAFYRIGGVNPGQPRDPTWVSGQFVWSDLTPADINSVLTNKKGVDTTLFPASSDRTINVEASYGGIERDPVTNAVTGAKAVAMTYLLAEFPDGSDERNGAIAWEDQLNYLIGKEWTDEGLSEGAASGAYTCAGRACSPNDDGIVWSSTLIDIFPSTAGATSRELGKNIRGDLGALNAGFGIILLYAIYIFFRLQPVKSRSLLAISGCVSVGLSIAFAFSFTVVLGFKLNPVINVLPFVLIGIGVDDMFVLIAALEATDKDLPVPERMGKAMAQAGVSITITSLTDILAFILGATSQLPALSTFCVFAAVGIAADYLLQISFFAAWMALDAYREKKKRADCSHCCCNLCCTKPVEAEFGVCCCACTYGCGKSCAPKGLKPFIKAYYIPLLRQKWFKALVIVGFFGYAGFSGWAASNLKQDFQFRWFVNDDAQLQRTFDVQDDYFGSTGLPVSVVTPPSADFDYAPIAHQQKLKSLAAGIEANTYIEADSLSMWYPLFVEWIHECGETVSYSVPTPMTCVKRDCTINGFLLFPHCTKAKALRDVGGNNLVDSFGHDVPGVADAKYLVDSSGATVGDTFLVGSAFIPPAHFYKWLDQFLADSPLGAIFASEVIWSVKKAVRDCAAGECGLNATRIRANYKALDKADEQIASMATLRTAVDAAEVGNAFPYMFMYLYYEQYAIIQKEAVFNLALALVAVFIITLVMIANLGASILVLLCVVLVDVDILGLMWMWGLTIDSVAIINLVLAIGLAVDYSAHVAHAFCQIPGTRQERADKAVEEMGTAVIHGAFSTFLAVLVLSISKSYIFRIFFKQFFGICLFGGLHGLVFLPTMLSLVGPAYSGVGSHEGYVASAAGVAVKGKGGAVSTASSASSADDTPAVADTPASPPPSAPNSRPNSRDGTPPPSKAKGMSGARVAPAAAAGRGRNIV